MNQMLLVILLIISLSSRLYAQIDLETIKQIESGGNPTAFNQRTGALGAYQITRICLTDFNKECRKSLKRRDLYNQKISRRIARWYLEIRIPQILKANGIQVTKERVLAAYNGGPRRVIKRHKLPKETTNYIKKYNKFERTKRYIK